MDPAGSAQGVPRITSSEEPNLYQEKNYSRRPSMLRWDLFRFDQDILAVLKSNLSAPFESDIVDDRLPSDSSA